METKCTIKVTEFIVYHLKSECIHFDMNNYTL